MEARVVKIAKVKNQDRATVSSDKDAAMQPGRKRSVTDTQTWDCELKALLPRGEYPDPVVSDMDDLKELHVAAILANVEALFGRQQPKGPGQGWCSIYSSVGPVLIAMNPCTPPDSEPQIYGSEWVKAFRVAGNKRAYDDGHTKGVGKELGPHCYATAEQAFQALRVAREQSIVICGESGAGKTVTNRKMLEYIMNAEALSQPTSAGNSAALSKGRIAEANALLEAFGNAKTVRNDNSSRFGKYSILHFRGAQYEVKGYELETYLLERSRVTAEPQGERNYHVFHQLFHSAEAKSLYGLDGGPSAFNYTRSGALIKRVDQSAFPDAKEFQELCDSMERAGINEDARKEVFSSIAAVLHLGNVEFEGDRDKSRVAPATKGSLEKACQLLGVGVDKMQEALVSKKTLDSIAQLGKTQAEALRDAVAKAIYSRMFDDLVGTINRKLVPGSSSDDDGGLASKIGLLDIFGFEDMPTNSLEQMYINLTNERIQFLYNTIMFDREREVYKQEGLENVFDPGQSNWECIELFTQGKAGKTPGIVKLITDSVKNKAAKKDGESIVGKLNENHKKHEFYSVCDPQMVKLSWELKRQRWSSLMQGQKSQAPRHTECFCIHHYAGAVIYTATDFVPKSDDALQPHIAEVLAASKRATVKDMFSGTEASRKTVGERFVGQLEALATRLSEGKCSFVRCIKPNLGMLPGIVDRPLVLEQLTCGGVVKAVEMRRRGYPDRRDYNEFCQEFSVLEYGKRSTDPKERCLKLFERYIGKDSDQYALGISRIFLKSNVLSKMRAFVDFKTRRCATKLQRHWRNWKGTKLAHDFEEAQRRLNHAKVDASSKGVEKTRAVAKALSSIDQQVADVVKAMKDAHSPANGKSSAEIKKAFAQRMAAQTTKVCGLRAKLDAVAWTIEEAAKRKAKACEVLTNATKDARRQANELLSKVNQIEAESKGQSDGRSSSAQKQVVEACARAQERIDKLCRHDLEKLSKAEVDWSEDAEVKEPPEVKQWLQEAMQLVGEAQSKLEELRKVRGDFVKMAAEDERDYKKVRERLEELQAEARQDIADGLNGVGKIFEEAWAKETKARQLLEKASDASGFKAAVKDLVAMQGQVESVCNGAAQFRKQQAAEKARAEMDMLTKHVKSLDNSQEMRTTASRFHVALRQFAKEEFEPSRTMEGFESRQPHPKVFAHRLVELGEAMMAAGLGSIEKEEVARSVPTPCGSLSSDHVQTGGGAWNIRQTHDIGDKLEALPGKARELDRSLLTSIRSAVQGLNSGIYSCPEGYCFCWSENKKKYYLIFRQDMRHFVETTFAINATCSVKANPK